MLFSLARNTAALLVATLLNQATAFILIWLLSRALGVEGVGRFSVILTFVNIAVTIGGLGLDRLIVREIAGHESRQSELVMSGLLLELLGSVPVVLLALLVGPLLTGIDEEVGLFLIIGGIIFSVQMSTLFDAVFVAVHHGPLVTYVALLKNIVKLGMIILVLRLSHELTFVFTAILFAEAIAVAISLLFVRQILSISFQPINWELTQRLLRLTPTFAILAIASIVMARVHVMFIKYFWNDSEAGIYSAAFFLLYFLILAQDSLMRAVYPHLSRWYCQSITKLSLYSTEIIRGLYIFSIPIGMGTLVLANQIIGLIYPSTEFVSAAAVLRVLVIGIIPMWTNNVLWRIIMAADREKINLQITTMNMILTLGTNLLLVPLYGAIGAAISMVVVQLLALLQNSWHIRRQLFIVSFLSGALKPTIAASVMVLVFITGYHLEFIVLILLGGLAYVVTLLTLHPFTPEGLQVITSLYKKQRSTQRLQ